MNYKDKYDIYVKQSFNSNLWEYKLIHAGKENIRMNTAASSSGFKTRQKAIDSAKSQIDTWQQVYENEQTWEKV